MIAPGLLALSPLGWQAITSVLILCLAMAAGWAGYRPVRSLVLSQERLYESVFQRKLLLDIRPRVVTILSVVGIVALAIIGQALTRSYLGAVFGVVAGLFLPTLLAWCLRRRHLAKLEGQLVHGIRTLTSGVRAGLNLIQSMQLIARDGPPPLRHEFAHLLKEYEYGIPLDEAMDNAAARIGSGDFRLLFAALQTHRERGGDLGETLDRIGESVREIQRLENRVKTLTAQGRATARWLGAMPVAVMAIIYFMVDPEGLVSLFEDPLGKLIILAIVALNLVGFLWIRKIVSLDI
ncbi:MAG TPA: type II secretion system F family protein [Phycisphaerae bacterium]|nr:type II secretion system F family protein [Phycisphaerae bacterium]